MTPAPFSLRFLCLHCDLVSSFFLLAAVFAGVGAGWLPLFASLGYMATSSSLLVINKVALVAFPFPAAMTALQYLATVVFAWCALLGTREGAKLDYSKMRAFAVAAFLFYMSIYSNTMTLKGANVETVIVFRAAVPLLAAVLDRLARKTPLPTLPGWCAILVILVGAVGYAITDSEFNPHTYAWASFYVLMMAMDSVYGKHVVSTIGLSTWGLMLYNNLGALSFFPFALVATGELADLAAALRVLPSAGTIAPVAASCLAGCAISFFGFSCRSSVSATSFTVIGVLNKIAAVLINVLAWERHASNAGLAFIGVSILGGVWYQIESGRPVRPAAARATVGGAAAVIQAARGAGKL